MNKKKLSQALIDIYDLVSRLRGPGGCPWDARQTDATLRMYLMEEAYEVVDAVERGSADDVCQELGDLLFMVFFMARLGEETGHYDLVDVAVRIKEKMIGRHPHVFGKTKVDGPEDVARNWQKIKEREKEGSANKSSSLMDVPPDLPALLRAHRLGERASRLGSRTPEGERTWRDVQEAYHGLGRAISHQDQAGVGKEMGTLLFLLADLTRQWGLNAEDLLRMENRAFLDKSDP